MGGSDVEGNAGLLAGRAPFLSLGAGDTGTFT